MTQNARDISRFKELLDAAPDGIIEVDESGRIVLLNAMTCKIFGYSKDEMIGKSVDDLIPDQLRHIHTNHRMNYAHSPSVRPMGTGLQLFGKRKDGSQFPLEISLSPVRSEAGFRVTAIIRDVSERKEAEERLNRERDKLNAELAAANRELEVRNKEIDRANRLKSEFLASMSHELRTPLHTIVGFSELLAEELEGPLNEKQKRFVGHIRQDSMHLLELINDVLDLSKIEAGKLELHLEAVNASEAMEEVLSSIAPLAAAKNISLRHDIQGSFEVLADRLRFKQILFNLLNNAIKFTAEGGSVSADGVPGEHSIQFGVNDTGVGIAQSDQAEIFQKFRQVGSTTKGVREGTGLGLAITKHLVESHGGSVWVESRLGVGSTFFFTMPSCD